MRIKSLVKYTFYYIPSGAPYADFGSERITLGTQVCKNPKMTRYFKTLKTMINSGQCRTIGYDFTE